MTTDTDIPQTEVETASQNEIDNSLIAEWTASEAASPEAAPEPEIRPPVLEGPPEAHQVTVDDQSIKAAPAPISAAEVAGDKPVEPVAPDASALRDQLAALTPAAAPVAATPDTRDDEIAQLRTALQAVSQGQVADPVAFLKHTTGLSLEELVAKQQQADPAVQAAKNAQQALDENAALRQQLAEEKYNAQMRVVAAGVTTFVHENNKTYPITNLNEDSVDLVFEQMKQTKPDGTRYSESEAAAYIESTLQAFVIEGAKLLGLGVSGNEGNALGTSEPKTLNPTTAGSTPSSKSWDEMSDDERDRELISQL